MEEAHKARLFSYTYIFGTQARLVDTLLYIDTLIVDAHLEKNKAFYKINRCQQSSLIPDISERHSVDSPQEH